MTVWLCCLYAAIGLAFGASCVKNKSGVQLKWWDGVIIAIIWPLLVILTFFEEQDEGF